MGTALQTIDPEDLVRRSGGHPLVRHLAPHRVNGEPTWAYGAAVALVNGYWAEAGDAADLMVVGPPQDAAVLATKLATQPAAQGRGLSMPAAAYDLVDDGVLAEQSRWGFRWIDEPLAEDPTGVGWLRGADDEVGLLLDEAFPDASTRPGSARVSAWAGLRDDAGRLVACAADTTEAPGVGFVAAITTRAQLRGQGLGRRVTGWMLNRLVEREGTAALWHYGGNLAAARLYDALGMQSLPMVAAAPAPSIS